jgi:hypothetical protein
MNIYNEQGDLTSRRVSNVSRAVSDEVAALATSLLSDGVPVVEVRAMLDYIETEMKFLVTGCLMEHRIKDVGGWPVPVEVHGKYPACSADDCPHHKECANHSSAGDHRSHGGDTPTLVKSEGEWLCTKCPESRGRGAILIDGTYMDKD